MDDKPTLPLARVNARVRAVVESETLDEPLWTGGFIHHIRLPDSGHAYFILIDGDYSLHCMLPRDNSGSIPFELEDGMEVEVYGLIAVYDRKAEIQLVVEQMRLLQGNMATNIESVKQRLRQEGLFPAKKKALPTNPSTIRLITSKSSKAIDDFKNTYWKNGGKSKNVYAAYVRLEGGLAAREIAAKINELNDDGSADVIVLTRGGGEKKKLSVFNDYVIAEAICRSRIPIITGIGHATDETLADEVADDRADTPSEAALLLTKREAEHRPVDELHLHNQQQGYEQKLQRQRNIIMALAILIAIFLVAVLIIVLMQG